MERKATGMVPQVLEETRQWLADHPNDTNVRTAFLGLVERQASGMVPRVAEETRQWLADHPDDTSVRTAFLTLVERKAPDMVPHVVKETSQWLADHPNDTSVRTAFLRLVERVGTTGDLDSVIESIQHAFAGWADEEAPGRLFNLVIGKRRLEDAFEVLLRRSVDQHGAASIAESIGTDSRRLVLLANWLRDQDYSEQAKELYELIIGLPLARTSKVIRQQALYGYGRFHAGRGDFAPAARLFGRTLKIHKGHIAARIGLAEALQELGNSACQRGKLGARDKCFEKAKAELEHAVYWAHTAKRPVGFIHAKLGWLFLSWGENELGLEAFVSADRQPEGEHYANLWGQGVALKALGRREDAAAALSKALEIAPEDLTSPDKEEISRRLEQCRRPPMGNRYGLVEDPEVEEE